ncbi:hypothetical protein [Undibacterium oligocarboniphilum]|uniref:Uncharacterized protein n=1 Tax=Undibacterium oligocarboniphilum TaxID=666702 RepID=A0A850QMV8_9BURK|nr:hypothetical protein [Undibacterium oligocarboniphilum]MBC3871449.1 hypothetical protein [Undibacterium oligocarboniphilum]NVO78975.1 hypothetical protein [Undibacterium oligocarboniphilum]
MNAQIRNFKLSSMRARSKNQRGYFLIDLGLALLLATYLLSTQFSQLSQSITKSMATATGQYMVALQTGLNRYYLTNNAAIQAGSGVAGFVNPLKPTTQELRTAGFLDSGFGLISPLGLQFVHEFKITGGPCPPNPSCTVNGLSHSSTPYTDSAGSIRNDVLSQVVSTIGNDGSQSMAGSGGAMTGYASNYSYPAALYSTVEGAVGIRIGDNSGIGSLLSQFYKLDGSRKLAGPMDANGNNILNINDLSSAGTATLNNTVINGNAVINGSLMLPGPAAAGSACVAGDNGKLKTNANGSGLVICNGSQWMRVGDAVTGISAGSACSVGNQIGTDANGIAFVCNGSFWYSLSNFASLGNACSPAGRTATSLTTNEQLICKNGQYIRLTSLLNANVQTGNHIAVQDGSIVQKPTCDLGGVPNYSLVLTQSAVDVSITPPYQATYVAAQNNGSSWTVLLRLQKSAADGGGTVSGNNYGLSAVMTVECSY